MERTEVKEERIDKSETNSEKGKKRVVREVKTKEGALGKYPLNN